MSAELLREAATLMRERAEAATTPEAYGDVMRDHLGGPWGEHAASWHPLVALAVAELLNEVRGFYEYMASTNYYLKNPADLLAHPMVNPALTVARAYLGRDA